MLYEQEGPGKDYLEETMLGFFLFGDEDNSWCLMKHLYLERFFNTEFIHECRW